MYIVADVTIREEPHHLSEEFRSFWGGYKVEFKIIDSATYKDCGGDERKIRMVAMSMADGSKRFPLDISKHEYVEEKVAELIDDVIVYAYSPQMLVAEKVRAICQQMPEYVSFVKSHQECGEGTFWTSIPSPNIFRSASATRAFIARLQKSSRRSMLH